MSKKLPKQINSGRKLGTPNVRTKELRELIEAKYPDFHPVIAMLEVWHNKRRPFALRFDALKEAAQYIQPKRKAIEISGSIHKLVRVVDLSTTDEKVINPDE